MTDTAVVKSIPITLGGKSCRLSYPMHAVILYQQETARIERSRPRAEDPDPRCMCGARRSAHTGPQLIRLDEAKADLLCAGFRKEDPLIGDSLFAAESWLKFDLNIDPERWLVCLWVGLFEIQGTSWKSPFTLDELQAVINLSSETRDINTTMLEAMVAAMPKAKKAKKDPDPNAQTAGGTIAVPGETNSPISETTSPGSGPVLVNDSASPAKSS